MAGVRGVKGLLGLSPLGLISRLLRVQIRPLYIIRGDVSIYNQARIKKENPSLLPGRGQTPRGRLSLTLATLAVNSTLGTVAPRVL